MKALKIILGIVLFSMIGSAIGTSFVNHFAVKKLQRDLNWQQRKIDLNEVRIYELEELLKSFPIMTDTMMKGIEINRRLSNELSQKSE